MLTGRGHASALLQKVNSQLRGERVPLKTKEEDELATYLNSLTQKQAQVSSSANFDDYGDISISSDAPRTITPRGRRSTSPAAAPPPSTSKFLKKKTPQAAAPAAVPQKGRAAAAAAQSADYDDEDDHRAGGQIVITGKKKVEASKSQPGKSSALNKASALANKIQSRRTDGIPIRRQMSRDSEADSESEMMMRRPGSADTSVGRDGRKFLKGRKSLDEDGPPDRGSPSPQALQRSSSLEKKKKSPKKSSKARGEIVRTLGSVYLTSEEESLADFIHGLSISESIGKRPQNLIAKKQQKWKKKTPSRQSPSPVQRSRSPSPFKRNASPFAGKMSRSVSQDSLVMDSLDVASEIMDIPQRTRADSASSDDPLNINLMDITSLIPISPRNKKNKGKKDKKKQASGSSSPFKASSENLSKQNKTKSGSKKKPLKRSDSSQSVFESLGIHMVDELLGPNVDKDDASDQSEIVTEKSDYKPKATRYDSESEIVTELGAGSRSRPKLVRQPSTDRSASEIPTERSESVRRSRDRTPSTERDSGSEGDYSFDSFESESRTATPTESVSRKSRRKSRRHRDSYTESYSRKNAGKRKVVMEQRETHLLAGDPHGGVHQWNTRQTGVSVAGPYGLQYTDPAPIATHVISADALEAMTAYNPSVLCLHEMMKTQVELVKNFADLQKRIYQSCLGGIKEDFRYTTLEDTKEYIKKNRKPKMTFKEALKLVEQEEGICA